VASTPAWENLLRDLVESKLLMKMKIGVFRIDLASKVLKRQPEMSCFESRLDFTDSFLFYGCSVLTRGYLTGASCWKWCFLLLFNNTFSL